MNFWETVMGNDLARMLMRFMQNNEDIGSDLKKLNENLEKLTNALEKTNMAED